MKRSEANAKLRKSLKALGPMMWEYYGGKKFLADNPEALKALRRWQKRCCDTDFAILLVLNPHKGTNKLMAKVKKLRALEVNAKRQFFTVAGLWKR